MIVISSREFRDNQRKYFDLVDQNEQVVVQRAKNKAYRLIPVANDTCMTQEEFYAKIDRSIKEFEEGKFTRVETREDLKNFLEAL
jgi:hypothetical protein